MWYHLFLIQFILNVDIYLPCINTQRRTTATFDKNPSISSSDHKNTELYLRSPDRFEGDSNNDLICLILKYQSIHYCNQSVLAIVADLNILVFSIIIDDFISISALVRL